MSPAPPHTPQTGEIAFTARLELGRTRRPRIAKAVAPLGEGRR